MNLHDVSIARLDGTPGTLRDLTGGKPALVVNVASKCGLTPQYAALQHNYEQFAPNGVTVIGVPCNQFAGQEPGSSEEIAQFCSTQYGVEFPMTEKVEVNGEGQHPLYAAITAAPDDEGYTGDIRWNFEKAVIDADGKVVARFGPRVEPNDPKVLDALSSLAAPSA